MATDMNLSSLPKQLFINNEFVNPNSTQTFKVYNPADGSLVADDIPIAGEADVNAAVEAAENAFPAWKRIDHLQRRSILLKFANLLADHDQELCDLTRITNGRPVSQQYETLYAVETFRYYAGWIDNIQGDAMPLTNGVLRMVQYEPYGVTAGIAPWNTPLIMMAFKAAPALAAGNCFILKPSEKTPFASLALGKLIKLAGFPAGVFQVLSGDGSTGALLSSHLKIRKISFTGSTAVGKKIQVAAANSNLKRVSLELGGKSPAVVFNDCNLNKAVKDTVTSILNNTGQACIAISRIYVQEGLYSEFTKLYKQQMEKWGKLAGEPTDPATQLGPLVDEMQFKRVMGFIERGQQGQGSLIVGGHRIGSKGFFVEPTVFVDPKSDAEILNQEIFGPVAVISSFSTEEEALELCNKSSYGLNAGVYTSDINKALRFADALESGRVGINCVNESSFSVPFGGTKQSGQGRELGLEGIKSWLEMKSIFIDTKQ